MVLDKNVYLVKWWKIYEKSLIVIGTFSPLLAVAVAVRMVHLVCCISNKCYTYKNKNIIILQQFQHLLILEGIQCRILVSTIIQHLKYALFYLFKDKICNAVLFLSLGISTTMVDLHLTVSQQYCKPYRMILTYWRCPKWMRTKQQIPLLSNSLVEN